MRSLLWVVPIAFFFLNPNLGCVGPDEPQFQYGAAEMRAAIAGTWSFSITPNGDRGDRAARRGRQGAGRGRAGLGALVGPRGPRLWQPDVSQERRRLHRRQLDAADNHVRVGRPLG